MWPIFSENYFTSSFKKNSLEASTKKKKNIYSTIFFIFFSLFFIFFSGEYKTPSLLLAFLVSAISIVVSRNKVNSSILFSTFFSLCIWGSVLWWIRDGVTISKILSPINLSIFTIVVIFFSRLFIYEKSINKSKSLIYIGYILFILIAIILSFLTGILSDPNQLLTEWHHWSAYIGPAELVLSGAIVLHDFPAQYGLGPTLLLANFCNDNCWYSMYFIVSVATLIFSLTVFFIAQSLAGNSWIDRLIVALLCLAACFFWNAYPPNVGSPTITPSVGGLRFIPAMILVSYLYFSKSIEISYVKIFFAHIIWFFGVLWSPESAFYVTFVWGSFYIFVYRGIGDYNTKFKNLLLNLVRLVIIWAVLITIFLLFYAYKFQVLPSLEGYLAYALYPPGEMPINYRGGIWLIFLVNILGWMALLALWKKTGDTQNYRRCFLLQLLFYSVFSYFLGRSHDNNLLNLMPFLLLVLLSARRYNNLKIINFMAVTLCAASLGSLVFFGWQSWGEFINQNKVTIKPNPNLIGNLASVTNVDTQRILNNKYSTNQSGDSYGEASKAIKFINNTYGEAVTILDYSMTLERSLPQSGWSAFHNPANVFYIPSKIRKIFLQNTVNSIRMPGWLLINLNYPAKDWLEDLDSVYDRGEQLEFGEFYAIRFVPRVAH